jgi:hypothetical protein
VFSARRFSDVDNIGALVLVLFFVLICLRNFAASAFKTTWKRDLKMSWREQFLNSGSGRLGLNLAYALVLCAIYLAANAALTIEFDK